MTSELLAIGLLLILLIGFVIWLGRRKPSPLPPRPPAAADFKTHVHYWLEAAAIEGMFPGTEPTRVRAWAQQIPDETVRDYVIDVLD